MEKKQDKIFVTRPVLPTLSAFRSQCADIWKSGVVTNNGPKVRYLEELLADYLEVDFVSLVSSGTAGLMLASRLLGQEVGRCITTPYSFCASTASPRWAGLSIDFTDVGANSVNICTDALERYLLRARARSLIIAVHCYGFACDVSRLEEISKANNCPLLYDASHAFGVSVSGKSLLGFGDVSVASLHATKTFNTVEGGLVISKDLAIKNELDLLRNFGFSGEDKIVRDGLNAKMSEIHAAIGIENLKSFKKDTERRSKICQDYDDFFIDNFPSIETFREFRPDSWNFGYYPILVENRDTLWRQLKSQGVMARRYFYPILSDLEFSERSNNSSAFPNARELASSVLCLPIYPQLTKSDFKFICRCLEKSLVDGL